MNKYLSGFRTYLIGFLFALALWAVIEGGIYAIRTYQYSRASASYLFAPTDIKDKNGKPLSREQLLDAALLDFLKRTQSNGIVIPSTPK